MQEPTFISPVSFTTLPNIGIYKISIDNNFKEKLSSGDISEIKIKTLRNNTEEIWILSKVNNGLENFFVYETEYDLYTSPHPLALAIHYDSTYKYPQYFQIGDGEFMLAPSYTSTITLSQYKLNGVWYNFE